MGTVLQSRTLSYWYGNVLALSDLSLDLGPGITALLGPNGSGKTTLMRLMVGFLRPRTGDIELFGERPWNNTRLLRRVGYAPETDNIDARMSAAGFVRFALAMKGIHGPKATSMLDRALGETGADSFAQRSVRTLSRGMRQRVKLAAAIAHDPEFLILDEPLTAVDPVVRQHLVELLRKLGKAGKTLLVSSHVLSQVETLTSRIVLLHRGRLLAEGDLHEIRGLIDRHPHTIRVRSDRPKELAAEIASVAEVREIHFGADGVVSFLTQKPAEFYPILTKTLAEKAFEVEEISCPDDNLEAVFRYLTKP